MKTTLTQTLLAAALAIVFGLAPAAQTEAAEVAAGFSRGNTRLAIVGGSGYAFNENYFVLGVGASYFLLNGLNFGLDVESWSGADPGILKVSPSVQYVFYQIPTVSPYIGAFYRRSYIDGLDDLDSAGGRAGVYIAAGRNTYFGLGMVYESYLDCDQSRYASCSESYPEASVTVSF
jgi:hypothetical protein